MAASQPADWDGPPLFGRVAPKPAPAAKSIRCFGFQQAHVYEDRFGGL